LLELPEQKKVGKYGRLHLEYLKAHRKGYHTTLLMEGTLNQQLYTGGVNIADEYKLWQNP
jgi:hypothetical protein